MDNVSPMQHLTQATKKYPNMSSWVGTFLKAKGEPGGKIGRIGVFFQWRHGQP
ncbi:hypothetical protein [Stutzerimonas stutzeri]|jgi:hypothetical protein|uniref:Uncharacterized protein n=1 Tax=Stutzerimonas stutzeri TaxID=316 RepID=A0A5S5BG73_STUST|nr:hypothetical protein [Stutzerimonas stutzeri]TYP65312.1 hypothetical protein A9A72_122440 [Stutzerimonas stutzeri]